MTAASHGCDRAPIAPDAASLAHLLQREGDQSRPSLENRVAFQWEGGADTLGYRQSVQRDRTVLRWLAEAVREADRPTAVLDLGCAYGNHLLMLNAFLGKDPQVTLHGLDLFEGSVAFGQSFAAIVPGYANCTFAVRDITRALPFDDGMFAAVNVADVLEHLERPDEVLAEVKRVLRPGGSLVVSTPLRDSTFKAIARAANRVTRGKLYLRYYAGKDTQLDEAGDPVMETHAGHDHISEMNYAELEELIRRTGFSISEVGFMPVMSGSEWFDRHPFLLSGLLFLEALHGAFRRPSWAHAACVRAIA